MANNPYVNKIIYDGSTLIDLTSDTVTPETLLQGFTAHDKSGALITGTYDPTIPDNYGLITYDGSTITVS